MSNEDQYIVMVECGDEYDNTMSFLHHSCIIKSVDEYEKLLKSIGDWLRCKPSESFLNYSRDDDHYKEYHEWYDKCVGLHMKWYSLCPIDNEHFKIVRGISYHLDFFKLFLYQIQDGRLVEIKNDRIEENHNLDVSDLPENILKIIVMGLHLQDEHYNIKLDTNYSDEKLLSNTITKMKELLIENNIDVTDIITEDVSNLINAYKKKENNY